MDNRAGVRDADGFGDRGAQLQDAFDIQTTRGNEIGERLSFHQFPRDEWTPVSFLYRIDGDDARMIEGRSGSRLAAESTYTIRIGGDRVGQQFEGHLTPQAWVLSGIHFAHSASADQMKDAIGADMAARRARHAVA